ncbi:hypothetical protein J416_12122 [Gracilibacillus halophilus YIM-C55.5]|uniref:Uncharacterized protein n=1 Tax=Gracilibacillus halophilus YIM-C55.5 TaxID=1308866 RepID=N4WSM0_9BACI|nr:hypothetical protein [Gracilibacillus halophilus]ENH96156.1 hypothetical protein J416_12122 [Gracilibacillus halophilus YIM-C55.5]
MDEEKDQQLNKEIRSLPNYQMKREKKEEIQQQLMETAAHLDQKERKTVRMKRFTIGVASVAVIMIFSFIALTGSEFFQQADKQTDREITATDNPENNPQSENDKLTIQENTDTETLLREQANQIVTLLANEDYQSLASYAHAEKGILFSPSVNLKDRHQTFSQDEISTFMTDSTVYQWGTEDGSGRAIEMTPKQFHSEYMYPSDYQSADEITFDQFESRGTIKKNIQSYFPESHAVEFYKEGEHEMGWHSLNIVFEQNQIGEWKVVALAQGQWGS